jgi:hypothetical protein
VKIATKLFSPLKNRLSEALANKSHLQTG